MHVPRLIPRRAFAAREEGKLGSAMMRRLMKSLEMLTLKCGTDSGFYPFPSALSQPSCVQGGAVLTCEAAALKRPTVSVPVMCVICGGKWRDSEKQHLVPCQGVQSAPISKVAVQFFRHCPQKYFSYFFHQNFLLFQSHSFGAACSAPHLSPFFVVLLILFLVHPQTNSRLQWLATQK